MNAPVGESLAQFVECTVHTHAGGVFGQVQPRPHVRMGAVVKEAQRQGIAVLFVELRQRLIEFGTQVFPRGVRGRGRVFHGIVLFTLLAASFRPAPRQRCEVGAAAQPAGQHGPVLEVPGLAGEVDENVLRHVLRRLRVARQGPERHAVDQPDAALHQLGQRRGVALLMKPSQPF